MHSRFLTWQPNQYLAVDTQIGSENVFQVTDDAIDFRFSLKGYGFKRVGELNRQVYHFGCYRCYYRKVGDVDFTLFAHAQSERADTESAKVYQDIGVACGALAEGIYEIKIVACKLAEYASWAGGVVEGIASGDKFYYGLLARNNVPQKIRVFEDVVVNEFAYQGQSLMFISAGLTFDEIIQSVDLSYIYLQTELSLVDLVAITDGVALSVV